MRRTAGYSSLDHREMKVF